MIDVAQSETAIHIRYMRKSILMNLLFTFFIVVMGTVYLMISLPMGLSAERIKDAWFLVPHPILLIALAISAAVQFYLLRKLKGSMLELTKSGIISQDAGLEHTEKSITDVNYEIVDAMYRSLKIWPVIALLFVLYFIGSIFKIVEWTLGLSPNEISHDAIALNVITLLFASIFFGIQTTHWLTRRKKLNELERMERTVLEELHI